MKLIRHILSHSILIGFVALMVLGFYYRMSLFPANWNEKISQQVDHVAGPYATKLHAFAAPVVENTAQTVAKAPSSEPVSEPAQLANTETTGEAATQAVDVPQTETSDAKPAVTDKPATGMGAAKPVNDIAEAEAVAKSQPAPDMAEAPAVEKPVTEPVKALAQTAQATESKVTTETEKPSTNQAAGNAAVTQQKENKPATPVVAQAATGTEPVTASPQASTAVNEVAESDEIVNKDSSDQDFVGINELWRQARVAYSQGDLTKAMQHYQALSEQEQDDPDVFGELGNVYYARGRFAEAGQAYYEAAVRLIELGQMGQVHYLVRVIEGLSPDDANKLKRRLVR